ncbi:MAG: gliding motility protein GldC [Bacteroidetes bacterium]|nr:MAG: gliding motility protein GldC [Bacteroidota bacterium]
MKKSNIHLEVGLDEQEIPEKINWEADDAPFEGMQEAKAFSLAIWDRSEQGTLKIDLWTKEMEVFEMKKFFIEILSGMSETIRNSTQDEIMAMDIENLAKDFTKRLEKEIRMAKG